MAITHAHPHPRGSVRAATLLLVWLMLVWLMRVRAPVAAQRVVSTRVTPLDVAAESPPEDLAVRDVHAESSTAGTP